MAGSLFSISLLLLLSVSPSLQQQLPAINDDTTGDRKAGVYVESTHPCVKLQDLQAKSSQDGNAPPFVPSTAAMACLDTVPIDLDLAQSFLSKLPNYLSFQSTLTYLAKPPSGSTLKPVDILRGLKSLGDDVRVGKFTSQIRFEDAVTKLFLSAHDDNLSIEFGASSVVQFIAPFGLVSLSKDGKGSGIYIDDEVYGDYDQGKTASAVTKIDGRDVTEYLLALSDFDPAVSPDARWNNLFATNSRTTRGMTSEGTFKNRIVYPGGDSFSVTFENGTTCSYAYFAVMTKDINGVDSGEDFFSTFAKPRNDTDTGSDSMDGGLEVYRGGVGESGKSDAGSTLSRRDDGSPFPDGGTFQGYPYTDCMVKDPNDRVAGFSMESSFVLAITSFSAEDETDAKEFQSAVKQVIDAGRDGNITSKLIIDVKGCGGDATFLAYDTVQQLFPQLQPYTAMRMRYTPALDLLMSSYSAASSPSSTSRPSASSSDSSADNDDESEPYRHSFLCPIMHSLNSTLQPFSPFPGAMLGPVTSDGNNFTHIFRSDLSDPMSYGSWMAITGHGKMKNATNAPPAFYPENVVLVTDGSCSGTCAVFAEMLTHQLGIRSVAVGGRNSEKGVIDVVGGGKGVQRVSSTELLMAVEKYARSSLSSSADALPQPLPLNAVVYVNLMDNIRPTDGATDDSAVIPLQFMSEKVTKADCRIFKSVDSHIDPGKVWGEVADIAWNPQTSRKCAFGSLIAKGKDDGGCSCGGSAGGSNSTTVIMTMTVDLWGPTATGAVAATKTGAVEGAPTITLGPSNGAGSLRSDMALFGILWAVTVLVLVI